jgi:hypothetical protein
MSHALVTKGFVIENGLVVLMARLVDQMGDYFTQSGIDSIECNVFDLDTETLVASPSLEVATSIWDTLQTHRRWSLAGGDATGYNFAGVLDGDNFPEGNRFYRVEVIVIPTGGLDEYGVATGEVRILYELDCINIYS